MISIVVPAYNAEKTINDTMASIAWQSFKDIEVIVVDDGSEKELTLGKMPFPTRIIRTGNRGPGAARNTGIGAARGELIFPLDSDDIILPNCLEKMSNFGQSITYCNYLVFGTQSFMVNPNEFNQDTLLTSNFIINSSLFPKAIWGAVRAKNGTGYDEGIPAWEDWLFWIECSLNGARFTHVPEWLFLYRKSEQSRDRGSAQSKVTLRAYIEKKLRGIYGDKEWLR